MSLHVIGKLFNFAAYAFAPAILVTPFGTLSVLTGTVLGAYFLGARLDIIGRLGLRVMPYRISPDRNERAG